MSNNRRPQTQSQARKKRDEAILAFRKKHGITAGPVFDYKDRAGFMDFIPLIKELSKAASVTAGLVLAGSLTFLGIISGNDKIPLEVNVLKVSWLFLGIGIGTQFVVYMYIFGVKARARSAEKNEQLNQPSIFEVAVFDEIKTMKQESYEYDFRRNAELLSSFLFIQVISVLIGSIAVVQFVIKNI